MSAVPPVCRRIRHLRRVVVDVYARVQKRDWLRACRVYQNVSSESTTEGASDAMVVVWRQTARRRRQNREGGFCLILRAAVSLEAARWVAPERVGVHSPREWVPTILYDICVYKYMVCDYSHQVRSDNGSESPCPRRRHLQQVTKRRRSPHQRSSYPAADPRGRSAPRRPCQLRSAISRPWGQISPHIPASRLCNWQRRQSCQ